LGGGRGGLGAGSLAAIAGGIGILTGGIAGFLVGSDKEFPIVNSDPNSLSLIVSRLRKLAKEKS
jgi:hypothetical protein